MREWLWWGDKRVKAAKKILRELWLIDDVIIKDEKWIIVGHYVRVNYSIDENDVRTAGSTYNLSIGVVQHPMVASTDGWMNTNTLNITNKYPIQNKNTDFFEKLRENIPTSKWWDEEKGLKLFEEKMMKWISAEDMIKIATLDKLEIREKIKDVMFSQKKENWIHNFCLQSEEIMESRVINILRARYVRYLKWTKFKKDANTIADLWEIFGVEYINGLRKQIQKDYKEQN